MKRARKLVKAKIDYNLNEFQTKGIRKRFGKLKEIPYKVQKGSENVENLDIVTEEFNQFFVSGETTSKK